MITLSDYWMGRDTKYPDDMTTEIEGNAVELIDRVNFLLKSFGEPRRVSSGWRPPEVNAKTAGAALKSKHMLGLAIDLADPEGDLDQWCLENESELERLELLARTPRRHKRLVPSAKRPTEIRKEGVLPMNEEPTLPPVKQPNTPRVWMAKAWVWLLDNPIWFAAIIGVLVGLSLPMVARLLFG